MSLSSDDWKFDLFLWAAACREARTAMGLSLQALSYQTRVPVLFLTKLETGDVSWQTTQIQTFMNLCNALDLRPVAFFHHNVYSVPHE